MVSLNDPAAVRPPRRSIAGRLNRLIASSGFQRWAAASPFTRGLVRRDGEALFDLVAGFCHSQVLAALVEFGIFDLLMEGALTAEALAPRCAMPADRMRVLLRAGAALGLLRASRAGRFALTRKGAAVTGVPGLTDMIRHHRAFYRDLEDPVAFFRGGSASEVAAFWPYVHGAAAAADPEATARYSDLMARSQAMVAEDTLRACPLTGVRRLMDVGGGTGAFLTAAGLRHPGVELCLFDLAAVVPGAELRFAEAGLSNRAAIVPGSFRDDPLPRGCDAISLVRVLYDHSDVTVRALLLAVREALPPGGRVLISEPMSGGDRPMRAGDAYFALYTLAMGTGRARSAAEISTLCRAAGFVNLRRHRSARPFVTSVVTASKPSGATPV